MNKIPNSHPSYNCDFNWDFEPASGREKHVIIVYFIGGVTFGEISVIRYLAKKFNKEIYILTTNMTNRKKLISSFIHKQ